MADRQQTLINAILRDQAVASVGSAVGAGGRSRPWRKMLIFSNSFSACGRNNNAFGWRCFKSYLLDELDSGFAFHLSGDRS
jgi:hypothetical protein